MQLFSFYRDRFLDQNRVIVGAEVHASPAQQQGSELHSVLQCFFDSMYVTMKIL